MLITSDSLIKSLLEEQRLVQEQVERWILEAATSLRNA